MEGRCTCGEVRYRLTERPLFVHCCHCSWCQRETGTAFALNAMIEADRVELVAGQPEVVRIASNSGKGQEVLRCPRCQVALWSHYSGAGRAIAFVRVGTLEDPAACPPDIHIYTSTKLPWVHLDGRVPVMEEYYSRREHWPESSLARWQVLRESTAR
ncbi:GFA family protein [Rhodobacter sp. NSM]|uniref:GFA family protein n=1 Tax=Rhodobacter sp. NSM TaxID=3457501 RepID=UPI003FCFB35F